MRTDDFDYFLPEELIAQTPVYPRDSSKMLVYDRETKQILHKHFYDLVDFLQEGDLLVRNNTRVLPARLFAKTEHGGKVEVLLLKRKNLTDWEVLTRPARKCRVGTRLVINDDLALTVTERLNEGERVVRFEFDGVFEELLSKAGEMPLPPYIREKLSDKERYQTVYSKTDGSAAAPTAGLHFTDELFEKLKQKGVEIADVLLHVGLGTFLPVKVDDVTTHKMHSEYYSIDQENADKINKTIKEGRRVIAVGTTSVRTLESVADENGFVKACSGNTEIFIYPGYKFKCVKGLVTNFHLPKSTLIMLVSAFLGKEQTLGIYNTAVENKYRFFSFGDSCLFL
jgi:S-adenosylmethionine:tRNA ribosyltransferase-isomerase